MSGHSAQERCILWKSVNRVIGRLRGQGRDTAADILAYRYLLDDRGAEYDGCDGCRTKNEVAQHFGVSHEYVSLLEDQEVRPTFHKMKRQAVQSRSVP